MWASEFRSSGVGTMKKSMFARFMRMNGSVMGWRDCVAWPRVTRRDADVIESLFGSRHVGRGGLRIASTVVCTGAGCRTGNGNASVSSAE